MNPSSERKKPVKEGETYTVTIEAVGGKGDGIAKVRGFVLFVPKTKKGDYLKIKVTKVLDNVGFAEIIEKLERPKENKKFIVVSSKNLEEEKEPAVKYEDTEDFGEDLITEE